MLIAEAHPGATQYDRRIVSLGERSKVRARLCGWDHDLGLCSEQSRCWRFESSRESRVKGHFLCRSVTPPSRLLLLFLCFSFIFSCLLLFFLILIFSLSDFWLLLVEVFHWSMSCLLRLRKRQNFNAILFRKIICFVEKAERFRMMFAFLGTRLETGGNQTGGHIPRDQLHHHLWFLRRAQPQKSHFGTCCFLLVSCFLVKKNSPEKMKCCLFGVWKNSFFYRLHL